MNSAKIGDKIVINSETVKLGRNLAFLKVTLFRKDDNVIIAQGTHTKFVGWYEKLCWKNVKICVIVIIYYDINTFIYFSCIVKIVSFLYLLIALFVIRF